MNIVQQPGQRSLQLVAAGDAILKDRVGQSPRAVIDRIPIGQSHRGKAAIAAIRDTVHALGRTTGTIREPCPAGNSCANVLTTADGNSTEMRNAAVYTANQGGQLPSLQAYWDVEQIMPAREND